MDNFRLIRVARVEDIEHLVDVACEAWIDDPIFACVVPGRRELPEQYRKVWRQILLGEYYIPGAIFIAICKDNSTDVRDAVGFCMWQRSGSSDIAKAWQADTFYKSML